MTEVFFHAGGVYRHDRDDTPSSECVFVVVHVGRAPEGFAHPGETGDVAFGWRRGTTPDGRPMPLGSYATSDFTGWHEIDDTELATVLGDTPLPHHPAPPSRPRRPRND
ncbi:hypothetical protein [Kitasatospora sp. DSM 101779]|uniref:hypothetical protein n=1 Tax=Kitasatospora sp. DSM 101779 TaxID=2853165 RepID=UPI0021D7EECA|nr:hypothetical protein [Kitasatospora sp. DSM 101779]MCU7820991.1 hypothetical protein [Kitasatospora sp. DSM 101779]